MKKVDDQLRDTQHPREKALVKKGFALKLSAAHRDLNSGFKEVEENDVGGSNKNKEGNIKNEMLIEKRSTTEKSSFAITPRRRVDWENREIEKSVDKEDANAISGTLIAHESDDKITLESTVLATTVTSTLVTSTGSAATTGWKGGKVSTWKNNEANNSTLRELQERQHEVHRQHILPLLARSIRTTVTTQTTKRVGSSKRRRSNSNFAAALSSPSSSSLSSQRSGLMKTNSAPVSFKEASDADAERIRMRMSKLGSEDSDYIIPSVFTGEDDDVGVSRRLLDIHQISSRLHRSFPWEGLGLHNNNSTGSIGHFLTTRIGFSPATAPHTLVFSSFYIVPVILLFGVVIAIIWLLCACFYHTMQKIKLALCPGRSRSDSGGERRKKGNKNSNNKTSNNDPGEGGGGDFDDKKPQILTSEIIEMRRQERLAFLQAECANLEQQLTGLRASLPPQLQSSFEEKSATLTSRASDSDLEYLGANESPPLKRNSISLQDIPQSVIRIRREKELRQIKEEIEYLKNIAQQEKEKIALAAKGLKGSFLITQDFELPLSKPDSPNETKVEPLSQHISHLKTQRKLTEIRTELEDLALQLLHADEIKAKRSSLQDLPRTALNIQREQYLITMTNELQKMKNYRLQKRNLIETALEKTTTTTNPKGAGHSGGGDDGKKYGSKSFINKTNESPSTIHDTAAKYADPEFVHRSSIRRQREQELNRVRVELKDLAYKLNLNPMNYISDDRVRLVPSQSMQSTASATGQSGSYNRSASSSSALNHV